MSDRRFPPSAMTWMAAALALPVIAGGCGGGDAGEAGAEPPVGDDPQEVGKIVNVEVLEVRLTDFVATIKITGTAEAVHDAVISAEEGGVLEAFLVEEGARVAEGEAIAQIDDDLLRAQVDEARAAANLARETYERRKRLWEDEQVGTELDYLTSFHESQRLDAALAALETRLDHTTIRAPFAGVFDRELLDVGEMAAPGTPVARVIGVDRLKVVGGVPERYAAEVSPQSQATVTFPVLPDLVIESPIHYVGSSIDPQSRTFTIEVRFENPRGVIKPAMIAGVELVRTELAGVLAVPQSAVSRTEHGFQVMVVEEQEGSPRAAARPVTLGPSRRNEVVIREGLAAGDRVVVLGKVDDGDRVRVLREQPRGNSDLARIPHRGSS